MQQFPTPKQQPALSTDKSCIAMAKRKRLDADSCFQGVVCTFRHHLLSSVVRSLVSSALSRRPISGGVRSLLSRMNCSTSGCLACASRGGLRARSGVWPPGGPWPFGSGTKSLLAPRRGRCPVRAPCAAGSPRTACSGTPVPAWCAAGRRKSTSPACAAGALGDALWEGNTQWASFCFSCFLYKTCKCQ